MGESPCGLNAEVKAYDFQSDLLQQISTQLNPSSSSYTPNQAYAQQYRVMKANGRLIAGVAYQCKDVGIKFQLAKSFFNYYSVRDFNGTQSTKKLSSFTKGIKYRVR